MDLDPLQEIAIEVIKERRKNIFRNFIGVDFSGNHILQIWCRKTDFANENTRYISRTFEILCEIYNKLFLP